MMKTWFHLTPGRETKIEEKWDKYVIDKWFDKKKRDVLDGC